MKTVTVRPEQARFALALKAKADAAAEAYLAALNAMVVGLGVLKVETISDDGTLGVTMKEKDGDPND